MNPIVAALLPFVFILGASTVLRGAMHTLLVGIREKRWVSPYVSFARKNGSPFIVLAFSLSIVLTLIVPLFPLLDSFQSEGNFMTIAGILFCIMFAVQAYNPKSHISTALGCLVLALMSGAFVAGNSDVRTVISAFEGLQTNIPLALLAGGAIMFAVFALYNPDTDTTSELQDTLRIQRVLWTLFLGNLLFPFFADGAQSELQAIGLLMLVAFIKVIGISLFFEWLWSFRSRGTWMTPKLFSKLSVLFSVLAVLLSISSIAL